MNSISVKTETETETPLVPGPSPPLVPGPPPPLVPGPPPLPESFAHYLRLLFAHLHLHQFQGYFNATIALGKRFKARALTNKKERADYYRRCEVLSMLQSLMMMDTSPLSLTGTVLVKYLPEMHISLLDDSKIHDPVTKEIRDTPEPRGLKYWESLSNTNKKNLIFKYYGKFERLKSLFSLMDKGTRPIDIDAIVAEMPMSLVLLEQMEVDRNSSAFPFCQMRVYLVCLNHICVTRPNELFLPMGEGVPNAPGIGGECP